MKLLVDVGGGPHGGDGAVGGSGDDLAQVLAADIARGEDALDGGHECC